MFYDIVNNLCKARKTTITKMSEEIGLSNAAATSWKRGSIPKASTLEKISAYFGVSTDYLLGKSERFPYSGNEELLSAETLASLAGEEIKRPTGNADGLRGTGYEELTPANRKVVDSLIETLLNSQSNQR